MGSRIKQVRCPVSPENLREVPSTRGNPSRIANGRHDEQRAELHLAPERDGSSSKQDSWIGVRLTSPAGEILEQSFRLDLHASNNEAAYEALVAGMRLAHGLKIRNLQAYCDSQLVASQYSG